MKKRILIYDDEPAFRGKLREQLTALSFLESEFEVETPMTGEFLEWMNVLGDRQREFRSSGKWDGESILLDDAAIFIVDYDLFDALPFLDAETVAYLARCFSRCGLIIGVNQYGHNPFDLTLRGHPESFVDLSIGQEQLGNSNLWGEAAPGFHPWHWPSLPDYLAGFEKRVNDVRENLRDVPIWQVIGFVPDTFDVLPRSIGQFLGGKPSEVQFDEFVVKSGNGLKMKDIPQSNDLDGGIVARIGAARISKWLERLVLPSQTFIVDAPHLISSYPSLLKGDVTDIGVWNLTARRTSYDALGLKVETIESHRFKREYWLSRPVWFWDELRRREDILEIRAPWKAERPDWVFCEDASRFYDEDEGYREFVADTEPPFSRRFVKCFDGVKYSPSVRFYL